MHIDIARMLINKIWQQKCRKNKNNNNNEHRKQQKLSSSSSAKAGKNFQTQHTHTHTCTHLHSRSWERAAQIHRTFNGFSFYFVCPGVWLLWALCKRASFCLPTIVGATEIAIVEGVAPSDLFCCCRLWWATVCRLLLEFASLHRQAGRGGRDDGDGDADDDGDGGGGGSTHGLIGWLGSVCRDAVDGKLLVVFFFHFFSAKL